ncbi:MAG: hypothetical protein ACKVKX_10060 [Pseudomonadales bacterium]
MFYLYQHRVRGSVRAGVHRKRSGRSVSHGIVGRHRGERARGVFLSRVVARDRGSREHHYFGGFEL